MKEEGKTGETINTVGTMTVNVYCVFQNRRASQRYLMHGGGSAIKCTMSTLGICDFFNGAIR